MGWSYGINIEGREVGYSVEATCDLDGCEEKIDRGLAYVCGGMHDGDEHGCGRYFCASHMLMGIGIPDQLCEACAEVYEREHPEEIAAAIADFERRAAEWRVGARTS